ncbi:MAG: NUDIX domain-containing protein [Planctomycetaceae bacterium]
MTKVAIAVVESAGHVLVGTRPNGVPLAGKAEFPGGKCQPDETTRSCAVRECREETGLMVIPREHLVTTTREYEHGTVELDFWRCALSPDVADLSAPAEPFRWVPFSDLRYLDFPDANRKVLDLLLEQSSPRPEPDVELSRMIDQLTGAFRNARRPEHFTDYSHCDECAQHDRLLQSIDRDDLRLKHVGNPGWDPITFVSDDAYRYLLPGLARVMTRNPEQYFQEFLLHLRPERFAALSGDERRAVVGFLEGYRNRMARQITAQHGEWGTLFPRPQADSPLAEVDAWLSRFRCFEKG